MFELQKTQQFLIVTLQKDLTVLNSIKFLNQLKDILKQELKNLVIHPNDKFIDAFGFATLSSLSSFLRQQKYNNN